MLAQHVEGHDPEKDYLGANWSRTSEVRPSRCSVWQPPLVVIPTQRTWRAQGLLHLFPPLAHPTPGVRLIPTRSKTIAPKVPTWFQNACPLQRYTISLRPQQRSLAASFPHLTPSPSQLLRHFTARKAAQADALRRQAEAGDAAYTAGRQATLAVYREAQAEQLLAEQGGLAARCVSPAAGASGKHLAIAVGAVGALTGPDTEARGLTAVPGGASSLQLQRRVQLAGLSGRSLAEQGGSSASRGGNGGCGVTWQHPGEQGGAGGVDGGGEGSRSGQASSRSTSARGVSGVDAVLLEGLLQSVLQRSQSVQLRLAESCALKVGDCGQAVLRRQGGLLAVRQCSFQLMSGRFAPPVQCGSRIYMCVCFAA